MVHMTSSENVNTLNWIFLLFIGEVNSHFWVLQLVNVHIYSSGSMVEGQGPYLPLWPVKYGRPTRWPIFHVPPPSEVSGSAVAWAKFNLIFCLTHSIKYVVMVLVFKKISWENKKNYAQFFMDVHKINGGSQSGCCLHKSVGSLITAANQMDWLFWETLTRISNKHKM